MSSVEQRALALLEAGRARIAKGWCRGELARDSEGKPVPPSSPGAVSWCAIGGLGGWGERESPPPAWDAASDTLNAHLPPTWETSLTSWNDQPERTQDEVLALYDRTIAHLRAKLGEETP